MHNLHNRGFVTKKPVYGLVSITTGEGENTEIDETYYLLDKRLPDAIDNTKGLDVFDEKINDKHHRMPTGVDSIPHLMIDKKLVPTYMSRTRFVATCAYNATKEYVKHWLGREFDTHDRDWYEQNSLVTEDGLPQANSFTVLQQLGSAYGVGICNIIVPRNSRRFDEHRTFMLALGANPFFLADGYTTNEEAYEKLYPEVVLEAMGIDSAVKRYQHKSEIFDGWRFECGDRPFLGAIIMKQFQTTMTGHNGGSNYYGPRYRGDLENWWMAIKLDNLPNIEYKKPLEIPEYKVWDGAISYRWEGIKDESGKTLGQIASSLRNKGKGSGNYPNYFSRPPGTSGMSGVGGLGEFGLDDDWTDEDFFPNGAGTSSSKKFLAYAPTCETCQKDPGTGVFVDEKPVCQHCGTKVEKAFVSAKMIQLGWNPVNAGSWDDIIEEWDREGVNKSDKPKSSPNLDYPEYDPYFWSRTL